MVAFATRQPSVSTVHLYVFDGFADWEAAFAIAGLQQPDFQKEPGRWQVRTVGASTAVVRSMGNVAVVPDATLQDVDPDHSAMLILPGGLGWDRGEHGDAARLAKRFIESGTPVAAICGATAGLAREGLLDARRHTSNALAYLKGTGYAGTDRYEDVPAFNDGGLITAGGMAPLEFAREVFAQLGVYEDEALDAWYRLYKDGDSRQYARLQHLAAA